MSSNKSKKTAGRPREFDEKSVLESAMDVFWRKGFEATSLTELCRATGLHKGSLYQAFGDKRTLFMKALAHYSEQEFTEVMRVVSPENSPLTNIHAIVDKICQMSEEDKGCFMINTLIETASHDEEIKSMVYSFGEKRLNGLSQTIKAAQDSGEIRSDFTPEQLAKQLLVTLAGAAAMIKGILSREDIINTLHELIEYWR